MTPPNDSFIGRLLEEISWEGTHVRGYREGGRGRENVLTTQVWQVLHYLPREAFLGEVLRRSSPIAKEASLDLDAEQAHISVFPEEVTIVGGAIVQPDAHISTEDTYILVEAKRMLGGSFGPLQLPRELVAVDQIAASRRPVLLLVLGEEPPIRVKGVEGRLGLVDAVRHGLDAVCGDTVLAERIEETIPNVVRWTTWDRIADVAAQALGGVDDQTTEGAVISRLARDLLRDIAWHRGYGPPHSDGP